ncbi:NDE1, mitochondrial external NADH dehydrogenase [Umbelopsis sp. AD052]|nr:NDE1, mitochondrial external NADH dehydrogenase [Umbelopsis sp. AD052]
MIFSSILTRSVNGQPRLLGQIRFISSQEPLRFTKNTSLVSTKTRTLGRSQGRVVILGSGWAGFKLMKDLNRKDYEVSVVSPRNYFVFTPLLASTSVGTLEFRCITEPVRGYSQNISYHQAWCDSVDLQNQVIHCTSNVDGNKGAEFSLDYDKLVIGVGSYSQTFGIPGVKEHGLFLKDVNDARLIRSRVVSCFEYASQPGITDQEKANRLHFAVVGGGPTGIEFSAELYDFISSDMSRLYPQLMSQTRMTLYDVAPNILGTFDSQLSEYAHKKFSRKGIQIKTKRRVLEVTKDDLVIEGDGKVPYGMLVWSTGLMQNPLIESLNELEKDKSQRLLTDDQLRVLSKDSRKPLNNVYALGDCATIDGLDLPATAQVANQKAIYLSNVLNKQVKKGSDYLAKPFIFKNRGSMAYIGSSEALVDMSTVHQKAKRSGHLAWLLWRSAYLSMSVSIRNKMLIPLHWFLTWGFGRDISRF